MKEFNTAAKCIPSRHYMVNIADKVAEIRQLVDAGRYFESTGPGSSEKQQFLQRWLTILRPGI